MARKPTSSDLIDLAFVSDPQLSPDGRSAVCVISRVVPGSLRSAAGKAKADTAGGDYVAPRYRSNLHLFELDEPGAADAAGRSASRRAAGKPGEGKRFTASEYSDSSPRFSPDGSLIAFLSVRQENAKPQLHVIPVAGGEAVKITDMPAGVSEFAWHPDSRQLAFVSLGDYRDTAAERALPRRITRRFFRGDGQGIRPDVPAQVYLVPAAGGEPRRLTDLQYSARSLAFTPGGETLYLLTPVNEDADSRFATDLVSLAVADGKVTTVAADLTAAGNLQVSPSGRWLSLLAPGKGDDLSSPQGLWLLDLEPKGRGKAKLRLVSDPETDVSPSLSGDSRYGALPNQPTWVAAADGSEALQVSLFKAGRSELVLLGTDGQATPLASEHSAITAFAAHANQRRLLFIAEASDRPGELFVRYEDGGEVRLSGANDEWCKRLKLAVAAGPFALKAKSRRSRGKPAAAEQAGENDVAGRELVQYWTLSAPRPRADGAAVLQVHGGPHTAYGDGFSFEFQLMAARGYSVIYGNPRGSSSYGHPFASALLGRYGSVDADDVMDIGEQGLARLGDPKAPLHLTGGSYGGFMTNWLIGHTNRFRSAVTQRSICNFVSFYGTSDIGPRFTEREIGRAPWLDLETLWQQSPLKYVANVVTPLLIVHSENDFRCPVEQAEQYFTALKQTGKTHVEFLRVPGEGHELSRSGRVDRRIERLEAIIGWFESHP